MPLGRREIVPEELVQPSASSAATTGAPRRGRRAPHPRPRRRELCGAAKTTTAGLEQRELAEDAQRHARRPIRRGGRAPPRDAPRPDGVRASPRADVAATRCANAWATSRALAVVRRTRRPAGAAELGSDPGERLDVAVHPCEGSPEPGAEGLASSGRLATESRRTRPARAGAPPPDGRRCEARERGEQAQAGPPVDCGRRSCASRGPLVSADLEPTTCHASAAISSARSQSRRQGRSGTPARLVRVQCQRAAPSAVEHAEIVAAGPAAAGRAGTRAADRGSGTDARPGTTGTRKLRRRARRERSRRRLARERVREPRPHRPGRTCGRGNRADGRADGRDLGEEIVGHRAVVPGEVAQKTAPSGSEASESAASGVPPPSPRFVRGAARRPVGEVGRGGSEQARRTPPL